jgi:transcriptional regulator with XRE-family HTH domain
MDVRSRVGANVKRLREAKGLSQEELAFDAEMHRTYVSGIERGKRNPTVTVVERLAAALGAKASELLA